MYVCVYVCMYEHYPYSPHNGITIANAFISHFLAVNDNFDFSWNYFYYYIKCLILHFVCKFFCFVLLTRANFVVGFWAVKFASK
jgi:hypothetical protein